MVQISKRAISMLRNRKVASAVSMALASSQVDSKEGVIVTINGKNYTIKSASIVAPKKSA